MDDLRKAVVQERMEPTELKTTSSKDEQLQIRLDSGMDGGDPLVALPGFKYSTTTADMQGLAWEDQEGTRNAAGVQGKGLHVCSKVREGWGR